MDIFTNIKKMLGGAKSSSRTFTIHKIHNDKYKKCCGRYKNDNPQDAAKKAFRKVLEKDNSKHISFDIEMRETTRGSKHKIYRYTFTRVLRKKPIVVKKGDRTIIYKYKIHSKYVEPKKETPQKKSSRYECTTEEKQDKLTSACCSKGNTINKRAYESCKKHILRMRK